MPERFNLDQIRAYWTQQARGHKLSPAVSWSDTQVIELEIRRLLGFLEPGDHVLDVGCASGYSTVRWALEKKLRARGVDYIPEMIDQARQRLKSMKDSLAGMVSFGVADIMDLKEKATSYDKVIVVRVLINLERWENQRAALHQCARVLKKGGMLLLSEASVQGWRKLNALRREWLLDDIPMPAFNWYLDEEKIIAAASDARLKVLEIENFASTYYVGTRVLKPLLIKALGAGSSISPADPAMEWNRWFAQLPAWGDYGTQKLFIFRKE
jgi:ubiquinone/menaquinone biosynthesis C-methylase UbiE